MCDCVLIEPRPFHLQVMTRPKKKKDDRLEGDGEATPSSRKRSRTDSSSTAVRKTKRPRAGDPGYDPYEFTSSEEEGEGEEGAPTTRSRDRAEGSHDQEGDSMDTAQPAPVAMDTERYVNSCSIIMKFMCAVCAVTTIGIYIIDSGLPLSVLACKRLSPPATPKAWPWRSWRIT